MNINIAILEDNNLHFNEIKESIIRWSKANNHYVKITHFENGKDILSKDILSSTNLIISDIELVSNRKDSSSGTTENGIHICEELRNNGYLGEIIFLTAFKEYVFDGYSVHAMNFLIKPVSDDSISACMDKYVNLHFPNYYYHHKKGNVVQILYNDIISISSNGHECIIQTKDDIFPERISLDKLSQLLPKQFLRCHRTCIVNMNHITSLSGSRLTLSNNMHQTVSRKYLESIKFELMQLANSNFI